MIVEKFNQSGQSGVVYYRENVIAYASFCKWRQRFSSQLDLPEPSYDNSTPAFIDLSLLPHKSLTSPPNPAWHIVLRLGNSVELCLSQLDAPLNPNVQRLPCTQPVDMRKSYDGLSALVTF